MAENDESENWASMANPPEMIMKLMLLQKKQGFIDAFMMVKRHNAKGATVDPTKTLGWLAGLWLECGSVLQRENPELYGKIGKALEFDGSGDYVEISDSDAFSFVSGGTDQPFSLGSRRRTTGSSKFPLAPAKTRGKRAEHRGTRRAFGLAGQGYG